jgi:hypothetical protein
MKLGLKLGTSSEDWEDFILTRLGLPNNTHSSSSEGADYDTKKTGGEIPMRINLGNQTKFGPPFFSDPQCSSRLLISASVLEKWGPNTPSLKYFPPNSTLH